VVTPNTIAVHTGAVIEGSPDLRAPVPRLVGFRL